MCDYLERFTTHRDLRHKTNPDYRIVSSRDIDLDHGDLWGLVTEIRAAKPDLIVLVGYSELARDILEGLAERGQGQKYIFVMTDGAFSDTLRSLNPNAKLYFTSPASPHNSQECDAIEGKLSAAERKSKRQSVPETTEALAYDSVVLLAHAVASCVTIDRACILTSISRRGDLTGTCESYDFHEGERQHAAYYVYSEADRKPNIQFKPKWCARSDYQQLSPYGGEGCGQR
jgi:ABC-type branched-subunit amino acid transport system substrate-binding protein